MANIKEKVSVDDVMEVTVIKRGNVEGSLNVKRGNVDALLATLTPEQRAAVDIKFAPRANAPCPKCGRESRRHQGPEGEDPKNKLRICTAATCRNVFEG
jgi:hypothetical protein